MSHSSAAARTVPAQPSDSTARADLTRSASERDQLRRKLLRWIVDNEQQRRSRPASQTP